MNTVTNTVRTENVVNYVNKVLSGVNGGPESDILIKELEREQKALDQTRERYERNLEKMNSRGAGSETLPSMVFLKRTVSDFAQAIDGFIHQGGPGHNAGRAKHTRKLFKDFGLCPEEYAYIALKTLLDHWLKQPESYLQFLAERCTEAIQQEFEYRKFKAENKAYLEVTTKAIQKKTTSKTHLWKVLHMAKTDALSIPDIKIPSAEKVAFGGKLIELLIESTGAFSLTRGTKGKRNTPSYLKASEATLDILQNSTDFFAFLNPQYPIMVAPPKDWEGLRNGGYYSPFKGLQPSMIKLPGKLLRELENHDMPEVYKAVNAVQAVRWAINKPVLKVLKELWSTTPGGIAGLPLKDTIPKPPKPWGVIKDPQEWEKYKAENKETVKNWMKGAETAYTKEIKTVSKRLAVGSYIIPIAEEVKDEEAIYFPWTLDFRGRLYPLPAYVNPQAEDCGKALLRFADGKPLGSQGVYWLAVHGANTYGEDKVSFSDRVKWVCDNEEMIVSCAKAPLEDLRWADADKPFGFLAFCFEWAQYKEEGDTMLSYLPIAMDGTCNGLQHLSAMLKDAKGGAAVNLTPNPKPADIYSEVLSVVKESLQQDIDKPSSDEDKVYAAAWIDKVNRKTVKRPVMTTPYGVSHIGMRDQILEEAEKQELFTGYQVRPQTFANYLTKQASQAIDEVIVAARGAMTWLQEVSKLAGKEGKGMEWGVPLTGFKVIQKYFKQKGKRLELFIGKTRVTMTVEDPKAPQEDLDKARQNSGISPNFIHSLDAAMLMLTVNKLKDIGIDSYAFIHDSYGTHASEVGKLHQVLREAFIKIYSLPVLEMFKQEQEERIGVECPEIPPEGTLNINQVRSSQYFFA